MRASVVDLRLTRAASRYLSCLRLPEILALQGSPLLGAVFASAHPGARDVPALVVLVLANVCLMAHVFVLNDWAGLRGDLADPHRAASVFTIRGVDRREVGVLAAVLLAAGLVLFASLGVAVLGLALAIAGLSAAYSFDWKGRPIVSSLAHLVGGALHFLLGCAAVGAVDGRALAASSFFALTFAAGHLTQETRDHEADTRNAIRTNAVRFGRRRAFAASVTLFALAYAALLALALAGILPRVLALLIALAPLHLHGSLEALRGGLTYAGIQRLQARYRLLYAVIGLAMVAALRR